MHKRNKLRLPRPDFVMISLSLAVIYVLWSYTKYNPTNKFWITFTCITYGITVISWILLTLVEHSDQDDEVNKR